MAMNSEEMKNRFDTAISLHSSREAAEAAAESICGITRNLDAIVLDFCLKLDPEKLDEAGQWPVTFDRLLPVMFRSHLTVENFLRLYLRGFDFERYGSFDSEEWKDLFFNTAGKGLLYSPFGQLIQQASREDMFKLSLQFLHDFDSKRTELLLLLTFEMQQIATCLDWGSLQPVADLMSSVPVYDRDLQLAYEALIKVRLQLLKKEG